MRREPRTFAELGFRWANKLDTLARILRRLHWKEDEGSTLDDLRVLERLDAISAGRTPDVFLQEPTKYFYEMRVLLMTPSEAAAVLDDLVAAGEDTQPFVRGSKDFFLNPAYLTQLKSYQEGPSGAEHDARDHMLPNGVVLHRHRTWSAANSGPRMGNDPYIGTGLDPKNNWGLVAPRDGLQMEMACCGQKVLDLHPNVLGPQKDVEYLPPGCWIAMDSTQEIGIIVPYQVWYITKTPAEVWQSAQFENAVSVFRERTRVGTAFLDEMYYGRLHMRILELVDRVLDAAVRIYRALDAVEQSAYARLTVKERENVMDLVALVDRYNAPQLGACHHSFRIDARFIDEHVFHMTVGRGEVASGRLASVILYRGRQVPRVRSANNLRPLIDALRVPPAFGSEVALLETLALLVPQAERVQTLLQAEMRVSSGHEAQIQATADILKVRVPSIMSARLKGNASLYNAARDLSDQLKRLLQALPADVNSWLSRGDAASALTRSVQQPLQALMAGSTSDDLQLSNETLAPVVRSFASVPDSALLDDLIAADPDALLRDARGDADVRRWARLMYVSRLAALGREDRDELLRDADTLRQSVLLALRARAERRREAAAEQAAQEAANEEARRRRAAAVLAAEEARRAAAAAGRPDALLTTTVVAANLPPADTSQWRLERAFKYADQSCAFDALFAILFGLPNQWFRNVVMNATSLTREARCTDAQAKMVHQTLLAVIPYMEHSQSEPPESFKIMCPNWRTFGACLPGINEEAIAVEGHPLELIGGLCALYNVQTQFHVSRVVYGTSQWNLRDKLPPSNARLWAVMTNEPLSLFSFDGEYQINYRFVSPDLDAEAWVMTGALLHNGGHWHACLRDPRDGTWYRMHDDGRPRRLSGFVPWAIKRKSRLPYADFTIDPATYEPRAWLFMRERDLAALGSDVPSSGLDLVPLQPETLQQQGGEELRELFGAKGWGPAYQLLVRDVAPTGTPGYQHVVGVMHILANLAQEIPASGLGNMKSAIPWPGGNERTIPEHVNEAIVPRLQRLVSNGTFLGRRIPPEIFAAFIVNARKAEMVVDSEEDLYVPYWSLDARPGYLNVGVRIAARSAFQEQKESGEMWSDVLDILSAQLRGVVSRQTEATNRLNARLKAVQGNKYVPL